MEFLGEVVFGNTIKSYLVFAAIVLGSFTVARIARIIVVHYVARWAEKTETKWDDVVVEAVMAPSVWLVAIGGAVVGKESLVLTEKAELWVHRLLMVAAVSVLFYMCFRLFRGASGLIAEEYVNRFTTSMTEEERATQKKVAARVARQADEIAGMVIIMMALLTALSNFGVDLKAIWASLGVGGLALALAVKDPLSNVVGRMYIYSTGLFIEGHNIQIDNWTGVVTRIGVFRTTIELVSDMSIVTVPNSHFVSKPVKNNFGRKKFIYKWDLDVPYEVDADKLEDLVEKLKDLVRGQPEVIQEFAFVYVEKLDKYSKVVRVWFQARQPDVPASMAYGTKMLGEIQRLFARMDIGFAYPTYIVQVEGQDAGVGGLTKISEERRT